MKIGTETIKEIGNQVAGLLQDNRADLAAAGVNMAESEPLKLSIGVTLRDGAAEGTNAVETKLSFTAVKITDSQEGVAWEIQMPLPLEVAK